MALKLKRETALNLTLEGSTGSFSVGTAQKEQRSIEVKYLLTHVGLDFSSGSDEALLSHLAPVREIFDLNQLDFDEIMQRDIDDARVSSDLIPYLLDEKSADLIKLFPPVVVVVLPVQENENRPARLYPRVSESEVEETADEPRKYIVQSGAVGQEVFCFEQPIDEGKILKHDLVRLRLNTQRTRLVIVDGQHRAMALLALYRNLKDQWSDERRAPYKEYYSEWTSKYIQQFNLKEINLPVILCTFPSLDEDYSGDYDLRKASRAVFLTLNKNARKVSNSRNILLDDNDLIADFLRRCLSNVKKKDLRSPYSLRIHNIELDQQGDKMKIKSPIALSGVNHLYYVIEHLLLNSGSEVDGLKPRSGNFSIRTNLNTFVCMERLDGRNILGADIANSTKRDSYTEEVAEKLGSSFDARYGNFIVSTLEEFRLYEIHSRATLNLSNKIDSIQDSQLLFGGQGISYVFETHRDNIKRRIKEDRDFAAKVTELQAINQRLDATARRIEASIESFREDRAELCIQDVYDKGKLKDADGKLLPQLIHWFNTIYDNVLTTVAFQAGLICGFFGELEKANRELSKNGNTVLDTRRCFEEYIQQLNDFFVPKSSAHLRKLFQTFTGELNGEISDWKVVESNQTFREVVYRGEMQPEQWTKYKYLFLEIWKPENVTLARVIHQEQQKCREQVFSALYNSYKSTYCKQNTKLEENLEKEERVQIFRQVFSAYSGLLKTMGSESLDETTMKTALSVVPVAEINETDSEEVD